MTDLRTLLHESAPTPSGPLDMSAVRSRARHGRLRRIGIWFAGLVAVAGVGIPASQGLLGSADRDSRDVAINTERKEREPGDPATVLPSPGGATVDDPSGLSVQGGQRQSRPESVAPTTQPRTPPTTSAQPSSAAVFPSQQECSVTTAGMRVGEQRRCRFSPTEVGGASIVTDGPAWSSGNAPAYGEVLVTRGGSTGVAWTSNESGAAVAAGEGAVFAGGCGRMFLQPGDLVEVVLTKQRDDPFNVTLGAGKDWSCRHRA